MFHVTTRIVPEGDGPRRALPASADDATPAAAVTRNAVD
jgi:hypothetical protein